MEAVIGGHGDPERFAGHLASWRRILRDRVHQAVREPAALRGRATELDQIVSRVVAGG